MANYKTGNTGRFWDFTEYKKFNFTKNLTNPLTEEKVDENSIGWQYDNRNPMPKWIGYFEGLFGLKEQTYTFYKMISGENMKPHIDHFKIYTQIKNCDRKDVRRVLVMLEDWKPGHYLEIDGEGIVNWVAGDWFMWEPDVEHAAANIGVEDRYTLQITGQVSENTLTSWAKLYHYNIPGLPDTSNNFWIELLLGKIPTNIKLNPLFIYTYNQNIPLIDSVSHSLEETEFLNEHGIHFYLYEPLCSYSKFKNVNIMGFYNEFEYHPKLNEFIGSYELDSILNYAKKNNLNNITVHTCDYKVEETYSKNYNPLKIICDDIFLKLRPDFAERQSTSIDAENFTKKFISLNWRFTPHRLLIAAYLSNLSSNISWYYTTDREIFWKIPWIKINKWWDLDPNTVRHITHCLGKLNASSPVCLDMDIKKPTLIQNKIPITGVPTVRNHEHPQDPQSKLRTRSIEEFYNDSFVDIVTESRFAQPTGNYSEKTYQPMYYRKPFVLVAPPFTLRYLQEQGFKTFRNFWDESYDEIEDHQLRIRKIFEVIEFINSKPLNQLKQMYAEMKDILDHNERLMVEHTKAVDTSP
jgi:hypothetical protein